MRSKEDGLEFKEAAAVGTSTMLMSILAGTLTTVVVYIPMAMADGLVGMMTAPLSWTIFLTLICSFLSARGGGSPGLCVAQAPFQRGAHHQPHPGPLQKLLPPDPAPAAAPSRPGWCRWARSVLWPPFCS